MSISAALWTYTILQAFWLAGAIAAWLIDMLTPAQMHAHASEKGIPYFAHFGMWNDPLSVHPLLSLMVGIFWSQWITYPYLVRVGATALVGGIALNVVWNHFRPANVIESQGWDGEMSRVGLIHIPHTAIILGIVTVATIWIVTGKMSSSLAVAAVCIMLAHICVGTHFPLKIWNPIWNPLGAATTQDYVIAGCWAILQSTGMAALCLHALQRSA